MAYLIVANTNQMLTYEIGEKKVKDIFDKIHNLLTFQILLFCKASKLFIVVCHVIRLESLATFTFITSLEASVYCRDKKYIFFKNCLFFKQPLKVYKPLLQSWNSKFWRHFSSMP